MAEIVNLRQARKRKTRSEKETMAAQNRTIFGRTKAEREQQQAAQEKAVSFIEAHRREPPKT